MQLNPSENFYIVRDLDNPSDTNTYYVQATVRLARTGALLSTVNLVNSTSPSLGKQSFTGSYTVPADPGGKGYYLVITTFVYTNSVHTTLSTVYGANQDTYLVQQRFDRAFGYGGQGVVLTEGKVKEILRDELKELKERKIPDGVSYDKISHIIGDALTSHSSSLDGRFSELKSGVDSLSNTRKNRDKEMIDGLTSTLNGFQLSIRKEMDGKFESHRESIDSTLNEFRGHLDRHGSMTESKLQEFIDKLGEVSGQNLTTMIEHANRKYKDELFSRFEKTLRGDIGDDYEARAKNLIKKLL